MFLCYYNLLLLYISTGVTEIEEGEVEGHKIRLLSHTVGRMSLGAEPKVLKVQYKKHCTCYYIARFQIQLKLE